METLNTVAADKGYAVFADAAEDEANQSWLAAQGVLDENLPNGRLAIYEAGGGSTSCLPPALLGRSDVTVVDVDPNQIKRCTYASRKCLGDIQTFRFDTEEFDLVVCYNVIEHLADVEGALRGFAAAVRAGGLIFIGAPNPHSLSGVLSHYTPTWFHVWFYRHVHRYRDAGKPGHPPFPTVFHPLVSPNKLIAFMSEQGLDVAYVRIYESIHYPSLRRRRPGFARMLDILATAANALLLNRTDVRHGDYHAVFRKRGITIRPATT